MDAWTLFVNYSSISPVFALGFTTEQWGLNPFPNNLVAISGYLKDIVQSGKTEQAWTLPFSCSSGYSLTDYNDYYSLYADYGSPDPATEYSLSITDINNSVNICSNPQPCSDSGCLILIEGSGRTSTGPANSNIVGLSYAISTLLLIIITPAVAFAMGIWSRFTKSDSKEGKDPIFQSKKYNSPQQKELPKNREYFPPAKTSEHKAREIAQCSNLLREMYGLDIMIWGMESVVATELTKREEHKRKANALFAEIRRIVQGWKLATDIGWTEEERQQIEEIYRVVGQHDPRRYQELDQAGIVGAAGSATFRRK
jgi:hypothetical protein